MRIIHSTIIIIGLLFAATALADDLQPYRHVKVLATTYFTHRFSDQGTYQRVAKNHKRLGDFIACNFLPGGSIVMIPQLFKTTKLTVADTFGGSGIGHYKGKRYWKVDILCNQNEWIDDFDFPLDLYVVKYNTKGPVKNAAVRRNCLKFLKETKGQIN